MLKAYAFLIIFLLILLPLSTYALEGIQRAEIKNPRLVNSFGEPVSHNINTNQQVQVYAEITNRQDIQQDFVYIVQILNEDKVTLKLTWFIARLNPQQTLSPAISWSTNEPGTYTAEIYVWDSIKEASALAPSTELKIIVS